MNPWHFFMVKLPTKLNYIANGALIPCKCSRDRSQVNHAQDLSALTRDIHPKSEFIQLCKLFLPKSRIPPGSR